MVRLIYQTLSSQQIIYPGNWPSMKADGWRWERNLVDRSVDGNLEFIEDCINAFGKENVTVGVWFAQDMYPIEVPGHFAVYVRDVDKIVDKEMEGFDAAWASFQVDPE